MLSKEWNMVWFLIGKVLVGQECWLCSGCPQKGVVNWPSIAEWKRLFSHFLLSIFTILTHFLGERLIVLDMGGDDGALAEGKARKIWPSGRKSEHFRKASITIKWVAYWLYIFVADYHGDVNGGTYQSWIEEIAPLIPMNSVVVMDNASYHNLKVL